MFKEIKRELAAHFPFTALGSAAGIIFMILFRNMSHEAAYKFFYIAHPLHVFLSAMVTSSLFAIYKYGDKKNPRQLGLIFIVGYVGSIGIATISDSIIPHVGELILKMPHTHAHIGFVEKWWLVHAAVIAGIAIAYFRPNTHFSHASHVLVSTWASLFHIMMAKGESFGGGLAIAFIFIFLTLSVWIPCCVSDIVFPLLFVKEHPHKCHCKG
jgi:hypothetical protein